MTITAVRSKNPDLKLANISSQDKPWDIHKLLSDSIQQAFGASSDKAQIRRADRMENCASWLVFNLMRDPDDQELKHKLQKALFCRVRLCPTCQWRRSLAWKARFHEAWEPMFEEYPEARFLHVVLTVPNCSVGTLKETVTHMNRSWNRMIARKGWPALGFLRSVEVTRNKKTNTAHPHFHVLVMVRKSYFGKNYWSKEEWRNQWAKALKVDSESIIHPFVRAIPAGSKDEVMNAVKEVAKYAVKADDVIDCFKTVKGTKWFLTLDRQLLAIKSVTTGGAIKMFMNKDGEEDISEEEMIQKKDEEKSKIEAVWRYDWMQDHVAYYRSKILSDDEAFEVNGVEPAKRKWAREGFNPEEKPAGKAPRKEVPLHLRDLMERGKIEAEVAWRNRLPEDLEAAV
jgi:plasmid rolling circle replication initiator protein Rep